MTLLVKRAILTIAALGLNACPQSERLKKETPPAAPAVTAEAADAGWTLRSGTLEAWLSYHRGVAGLLAADGGRLDVMARARAELALRRSLGLSEVDLERTDEVVAAVVAQRTIATLTGAEAVKEFEKVTQGLKPEQRQKVEQAFGDVRARAQQVASLDPERTRFGDSAVDAVLAREVEVTKLWNALMDGRGDTR
jgi:hypothetical protein